MTKQLVEKYRPSSINGYVFKDELFKSKILEYVNTSKENPNVIPFPNLLLAGRPGTGKTTMAYILCKECNVEKPDIMYVNISRENSVDFIRTKVTNFCSTMPIGLFKVIILDEFDRMSLAGQDALKSMFEVYSDTARFIATANTPEKIITPLHSRFQVFNFQSLDDETFLERMIDILTLEQIEFDVDNLELILNKARPDMRKAINLIDQFTVNGVLQPFKSEDIELNIDLYNDIVNEANKKRYEDMRVLTSQLKIDELEDFLKWLFHNIEVIIDNQDNYGEGYKIIKDALRDRDKVADVEILISATVAELARCNG